MDLLERYKTDFRLSQNHTDNVWQKLILSFGIKAVRYLGFNYSNILYDDPDQRCSVIQLPQLHLLLYSGWDYSFLTLLEEKKLQKKLSGVLWSNLRRPGTRSRLCDPGRLSAASTSSPQQQPPSTPTTEKGRWVFWLGTDSQLAFSTGERSWCVTGIPHQFSLYPLAEISWLFSLGLPDSPLMYEKMAVSHSWAQVVSFTNQVPLV